MNEQIFKLEDKVFDIRYGWGTVVEYDNNSWYEIGVQFSYDGVSEIIFYTNDGKITDEDKHPTLSFTEYTLQGFSHKRFFDYKNCIGKWGKFWDDRIKSILLVG